MQRQQSRRTKRLRHLRILLRQGETPRIRNGRRTIPKASIHANAHMSGVRDYEFDPRQTTETNDNIFRGSARQRRHHVIQRVHRTGRPTTHHLPAAGLRAGARGTDDGR